MLLEIITWDFFDLYEMEVGISVPTYLYWRHKILNAMKKDIGDGFIGKKYNLWYYNNK